MRAMTKDRLAAAGLLLLTALLWSLGGVLIKSVDWNPMAIAGGRSAIALLVVLACLGRPRKLPSRLEIAGALAYAATVILFVVATRLTTAANAIFLQYTAPIYVAACSHWLLRERALRIDWLVIAVALGGIGFFFLDQLNATGLAGNLCGLASGVAFAGVTLLLRKQKDGSPLTSILLGNLLTALVGLPFLIGPMPNARSLIAVSLLGTVQLGLSYVLYSIAIKRVTAMEAILIPFLEPVLNPLWVMLLVGERPGFHSILGGTVVLGAVLARGVLMVATFRRPMRADR